jgi:hypothetical protein
VSHWAARLTILFVLAVLVFAAGFSGAAWAVAQQAYDCGSRVTLSLWSPSGGPEETGPPAPPPVGGCLDPEG